MRRHRALAVIAASLMLFASQAGGQQPVHRIGVLRNMEDPEIMQAWLEGLREHGYVWGGISRSNIVSGDHGPSGSPRSWLSSSRLAQRL